ncbi:MAG: L,D-transpeptidase family protein [Pseudomonadota bacterium]
MLPTVKNFKSTLKATGLVMAVSAFALLAGNPALAQVTAFKQAVAEEAAGDRDIAAFYRSVKFESVWTGTSDADKARRSALFTAMTTVGMHGLPEDRHNTDRLMRALENIRTPQDRARAELAMTKAFIQLARDMQSGALEPSEVSDEIKRNGVYSSATFYLAGIMESDSPRAFFRTITPQTGEYARLMKEKLRLEKLIMSNGWGPAVPAGALSPGQTGGAVVALRNRLVAMGYLERSSTMTYDRNIQSAVQIFQAAHGLEPDGTADQATMRQINEGPEARLRAVMVAMERERWLNKDRGERHILVNLTDFSARIIDNDDITFETRSVIGANTADRRSPEFSDEMDHMVINPTWNVPRSITVGTYLPQMQANPGAAGHLKLYDWQGREVPRSQVNFNAYSGSTFPFDLKQPPSQGNALGLVKYMFPNKYNIYLHDTPSKHLFAHERRAYSHGCIRLADPFDFGYALLAAQEDNPVDFFHEKLQTGQETRVDLVNPVPVHIIYRTAFTDSKGRAQYRSDVYGRDARIWNALVRAGVTTPALGTTGLEVAEISGDPVQVNVSRARAVATQPLPETAASYQPRLVVNTRATTSTASRSSFNAVSSRSRNDR